MPDGVRRVLMTADTVGGVWTYSLHLARELARAGVAVDLATMGPLPDTRQRAAAAATPGLELHPSSFKLEWMDGAAADLAAAGGWLLSLEAALAPDVVHINGYAAAALPFTAPKLVVAHSCVSSWWRAVHHRPAPANWDGYAAAVRLGLDAADHVVAPTAAMLAALGACHGPVARASVIPNGLPSVDADGERRRVRKQACVLAAGRLWDAAKNLDALRAVAGEVAWPIRIAGDVMLDHDGFVAGDVCGPAALTHLGRLDDAEMADAYTSAAIYALPARYEPFGLSVLEAASHGCALVLGRIDSLRENWEGAALFVDPEDHAALASALRTLILDSRLRALLAQAAARRARSFSIGATAASYLALYRELTPRPTAQGVFTCAS